MSVLDVGTNVRNECAHASICQNLGLFDTAQILVGLHCGYRGGKFQLVQERAMLIK